MIGLKIYPTHTDYVVTRQNRLAYLSNLQWLLLISFDLQTDRNGIRTSFCSPSLLGPYYHRSMRQANRPQHDNLFWCPLVFVLLELNEIGVQKPIECSVRYFNRFENLRVWNVIFQCWPNIIVLLSGQWYYFFFVHIVKRSRSEHGYRIMRILLIRWLL